MKESWKQLGFKDQAQYTTAMVLIASGILIAFLSFAVIHTMSSIGSMWDIQCYVD